MVQEDPGLQELVNDFITESREHLASVESDLLSLESQPEGAGETINRVFRGVHSVKGVAGFLGFDHINKLAHALESVLDLVRKERLAMSAELVDVLLAATDTLRNLIERAQESNTLPIDEPLQRLQVYLVPTATAKAPPPTVELATDEYLVELSLVLPRIALALGRSIQSLVDLVGQLGRVTSGGVELCAKANAEAGRQPIVVQLASRLRPADIATQLALEAGELRELHAPPETQAAPAASAASAPRASEPPNSSTTKPDTTMGQPQSASAKSTAGTAAPAPATVAPAPATAPVVTKGPVASPAAAEASAATSPPARGPESPAEHGGAKRDAAAGGDAQHESIRVSVHLLDRLMNLSGELVLGRNQLIQARSTNSEKGIAIAASRLNLVVSEMQEAIMQTRMQPIGTLFQRFPRVVRDLSGKLGKRCRLEIAGKEVDLDRSILESLSDPLTHIVRNSVDHGMEMPDQRRANNKPVEGCVRMSATQQGGNVLIEISDDGRGIDPVRLKQKAVEKHVITAAQAQTMSDRDAVHLIFAPGFSTAEKVTDVSGRGVGMDVVRSNIEKLGGHVEVNTVVGRGTSLAITIPLTLAILPAMVISCGPRRYVLAQANVAELVRAREGEGAPRIVQVDGREVLRLRGSVLPLLRLRAVLGEPADDGRKESTIVVVEAGNLRYGLVVDAPPDAEEIVVKPLGRYLKKRIEYAGATILGDGRVAMILDAAGIAEAAQLSTIERKGREDGEQATADTTDTAELVLFRNHPSETFAVPLGLVDRIQRVERSSIRDIGGRLVFADGERALPIVRLEQAVGAQPAELPTRVSVLVMRIGQKQFGVVAPLVEDITALTVRIDDRTLAEVGILGSFQLQERTVRLLDPTAVGQKALPQLFVDSQAPAVRGPSAVATEPVGQTSSPAAAPVVPSCTNRLLFAEDTKFFREHVSRILRGAGFDVTAVADGDLAWKELDKPEAKFDAVVTDIQMPNCDGFELTRRIRKSTHHGKLPVVALTSLSSTEHEAEGREAGVSAYLVKLDDAALVAAVREHAGAKS